MIGRIKTFCLHSLTIAWGYVLVIAGSTMAFIDNIGDALGDPTLRDQLSAAIGDARTTGRILLGISVITIMARLRSLKKAG
jgi:hypothetical protein